MYASIAALPCWKTPGRIIVPSSVKTLAKALASWYAHAATTRWVRAAMAIRSLSVGAATVGSLVVVMRSFPSARGSDVEGVGLKAAQDPAVQLRVGVGVHEGVQVHR